MADKNILAEIRKNKRFVLALIIFLGLISLLILNQFPSIGTTLHEEPTVDYNVVEDDPNVESSITRSYMSGNDLIIEFTNPLNQEVRIDGLSVDTYSIQNNRVVIYNYKNEYFRLVIGAGSDVYEFGITIILRKSSNSFWICISESINALIVITSTK